MHQCAVVSDSFMAKLEAGDKESRKRWAAVLRKRKATGEPYIMYKGNVNRANPEAYKQNGLKVYMTNICSEITLHTDENHSFVCCLSSLNLAKYDEWKDTDLVYTSTYFLDGVLSEFISRAKYMRGFENSVRSAEKGRALGLGVLGWHTYLQDRNIPFDSLIAQFETRKIFSQIKIESERASRDMATEFGEPLWCVGTGMRNTHLRAIAPTVSNSKLSGNVSAGVEPWAANVFTEQTAKGTFIRKNPTLEKALSFIKKNNKETWDQILADGGSVQGLDWMDEYFVRVGEKLDEKAGRPIHKDKMNELENVHKDEFIPMKDAYRTFKEINQMELVKQAGVRQQYVDQAVSLNLAFPNEAEPKFINQVHLEAYNQGIKTLYYMRSESVLRGDIAQRAMVDCLSCDG
jgi:ribonucleoside-diphosphate reductase alpha chain